MQPNQGFIQTPFGGKLSQTSEITSQWNKTMQQKKSSMILYVLCERCAQPNRHWMGNNAFVLRKNAG